MTNYEYLQVASSQDVARDLCDLYEARDLCEHCPVSDRCDLGVNGFEEWLKEEHRKQRFV